MLLFIEIYHGRKIINSVFRLLSQLVRQFNVTFSSNFPHAFLDVPYDFFSIVVISTKKLYNEGPGSEPHRHQILMNVVCFFISASELKVAIHEADFFSPFLKTLSSFFFKFQLLRALLSTLA